MNIPVKVTIFLVTPIKRNHKMTLSKRTDKLAFAPIYGYIQKGPSNIKKYGGAGNLTL